MLGSRSAAGPRLVLLDGLRFVAAFSVVMYHYLARTQSNWGMHVADAFPVATKFAVWGALGVQLFFLISGFVILMSAEGRTLRGFVASRVSRLYPAYWVAVLGTAAMMTWLAPPSQFYNPSTGDVLLNLTMTQEAFGVRGIDGVYWTLWVELLFYVLMGVLVVIGITERRILAVAVLWPVVGLLVQWTGSDVLNTWLSPSYAPFFSVGMVLYLIYSRGHSRVRWSVFGFAAVIAVVQATQHWVLGTMSRVTDRHLSPIVGALLVMLVIALVIAVTLTPLVHKGPKWLIAVGALTYPLYLIHENWGWWMIRWMHPILGRWPTLIVVVAFVLTAAWAIERYVERPLRGPLASWIKGNGSEAPAMSAREMDRMLAGAVPMRALETQLQLQLR